MPLPSLSGELLPVVSGLPRTREAACVDANARLVPMIVSRHFGRILSDPDRLADAHAAGYAGLLYAAQRFDTGKGFTFSTFATDIIRFFVLRFLRGERMQARLNVVSLETPLGEDGDGGELADMIADGRAEVPGAALIHDAGFERLADLADGRERELLRAVFWEERPLADVAREWGISRNRVHQIQTQALKRVRRRLEWQQKQERQAEKRLRVGTF